MACMMAAKGCGFIMATTLREASARMVSGFRMNEASIVAKYGGEPSSALRQSMAHTSNYQTKYLLGGSDWPRAWREVRTDDREALLEPALRMLSHFEVVGRNERLDEELQLLYKVLGVTDARPTAHHPTHGNLAAVPHVMSFDDNASVAAACSVDAEVYEGFRAEARNPKARFRPLCGAASAAVRQPTEAGANARSRTGEAAVLR